MGWPSHETIGTLLAVLAVITPLFLWVRRLSQRDQRTGLATTGELDALRSDLGGLKDRVAKVENRVETVESDIERSPTADEMRTRLVLLEERLKHLPTQDEVHELTVQMTALIGRLAVLERLEKQVDRIDNYLREAK